MSAADRVIDQHFMLQREVVDRMVAEPGSKTYGRLSVMLQYRYVMHKLFDVPPGAFVPPPKVTSSIVRMVPRPVESLPEVDMEIFSQVVALAFQQRRKTLRNALSTLMDDAAIKRAGVNPAARAETLDVAAFVRLHARRPICRITPTPSEPHCPTSSSSGSTFAALSLASCTRQSGQSLSTSFQKTFE